MRGLPPTPRTLGVVAVVGCIAGLAAVGVRVAHAPTIGTNPPPWVCDSVIPAGLGAVFHIPGRSPGTQEYFPTMSTSSLLTRVANSVSTAVWKEIIPTTPTSLHSIGDARLSGFANESLPEIHFLVPMARGAECSQVQDVIGFSVVSKQAEWSNMVYADRCEAATSAASVSIPIQGCCPLSLPVGTPVLTMPTKPAWISRPELPKASPQVQALVRTEATGICVRGHSLHHGATNMTGYRKPLPTHPNPMDLLPESIALLGAESCLAVLHSRGLPLVRQAALSTSQIHYNLRMVCPKVT